MDLSCTCVVILVIRQAFTYFFLDPLLDWLTVHVILPLLEAGDFHRGMGNGGTGITSP